LSHSISGRLRCRKRQRYAACCRRLHASPYSRRSARQRAAFCFLSVLLDSGKILCGHGYTVSVLQPGRLHHFTREQRASDVCVCVCVCFNIFRFLFWGAVQLASSNSNTYAHTYLSPLMRHSRATNTTQHLAIPAYLCMCVCVCCRQMAQGRAVQSRAAVVTCVPTGSLLFGRRRRRYPEALESTTRPEQTFTFIITDEMGLTSSAVATDTKESQQY